MAIKLKAGIEATPADRKVLASAKMGRTTLMTLSNYMNIPNCLMFDIAARAASALTLEGQCGSLGPPT